MLLLSTLFISTTTSIALQRQHRSWRLSLLAPGFTDLARIAFEIHADLGTRSHLG
jgi:hypothetical protein